MIHAVKLMSPGAPSRSEPSGNDPERPRGRCGRAASELQPGQGDEKAILPDVIVLQCCFAYEGLLG